MSLNERIPDKPWVVVACGGTIETALLPYHLLHLKSHFEITVSTAVSNAALDFVTETALRAITKLPVYQESQQWDPLTGKPMHLHYSEADLLVLYPASVRIIAQCAQGEITCPVTRLFAFTPKDKVILTPAIHPRMDRRLYHDHLERLESLGCLVLDLLDTTLSRSQWHGVEKAISNALGLKPKTLPQEVSHLWEEEQSS